MPRSIPVESITADSRAPLSSAALAATATPGPPIVALSEDHNLLRALALAVIDQASVVTSPSIDRFVDQLSASAADIALIDAAAAPSPLGAFLTSLRRQFPQLQLVLVGAASLQNELAAHIADGTIFRFAHKPASAQRLKLFLCTALRTRQHARAAGSATSPLPAIIAERDRRADSVGGRRGRWLWPLACTLIALGAAAAGWYASAHAGARHALP